MFTRQLVKSGRVQRFQRIAFLGSPGPIMLAFVRTCAEEGVSTHLLQITDASMTKCRYSRWLDGVTIVNPEFIGNQKGIRVIEDIVAGVGADGLIAVDEIHLLWLAENRDVLERSCRLLMPTKECLSRMASKHVQIEIATEAGFDILPTEYLSRVSDSAIMSDEHFPVCLRPSVPSRVSPNFKAQVFHSRSEVSAFLEELDEIQEPIIAQPFLSLPDLKVHGARSRDGRILAMVPFYVERKFEGVTLTLMRGTFPPGVRERCEKFAQLADLSGGFHFDLLYSAKESRAFYLEVNVRMGGITDKAKVFGHDQPRLILRAYGHPATTNVRPATSRKRVVTKRTVIKHMMKAVTGGLTELDYPSVNRANHIFLSARDLLFARDSVVDRRDLVGSIWFNLQGLYGAALKFVRRPARRGIS